MTISYWEYMLANIDFPLTPDARENLIKDSDKILDAIALITNRVLAVRYRALSLDENISDPITTLSPEIRALMSVILSETLNHCHVSNSDKSLNNSSAIQMVDPKVVVVNNHSKMSDLLYYAQWIVRRN